MFSIRVGSSRVSGKGWWWWRETGNAGASLGIGESLYVCSKGGQPHWPPRLPAARGPAPELTWPGLSPACPLSPSISSSIVCFSLSPLSLFLSPSDTLYPLPLQLSAPLGHTAMDSAHRYQGIGPPSFLPAWPHAMLGINMVPRDAQPVLRPPSCPAAPFLGHTAGEQVRGAGTSRMRHREIKLNAAPVLRQEAVNRA